LSVSEISFALVVHWLVVKLGMALVIASAIPLISFVLMDVTDSPGWAFYGATGPLVAGLYLWLSSLPPLPTVDDDELSQHEASRATA
jgi:hypothetical protein